MSKRQILTVLPVGPERDQAIARALFGQTDFEHPGFGYEEFVCWSEATGPDGGDRYACYRCGASKGDEGPCVARYSSDDEAAVRVLHKMQTEGWDWSLSAQCGDYVCELVWRQDSRVVGSSLAHTIADAVTAAALRALWTKWVSE